MRRDQRRKALPRGTAIPELQGTIILRCAAAGTGRSMTTPQPRRATMVHAYILIQTEVGKAAAVADEVRAVNGVTEADDVTGPYDVIVRAEAETVDDLGKLVVARIQSVEGITRTLTCPVVHL
jgi:DNA-binding Lrp family transcriptional regulator